MKFGIVIIATKNYKLFLNRLINSLEKFFNPSGGKKYFLITDEKLDWFDKYPSIDWTYIEHEPTPLIAVKKYEYISKILNKLKEFDYVMYIDSDMELINFISEDKFDIKDKKYFSVCHPLAFKDQNFWTVEKNKLSKAYIGDRNGATYVQSCLWGTKGEHVEYMVTTMKNNTNEDLKNGIIAIWHDESYLNKFFVDHKDEIFILNYGFAHPENWNMPCKFDKLIIHRHKNVNLYQLLNPIKKIN